MPSTQEKLSAARAALEAAEQEAAAEQAAAEQARAERRRQVMQRRVDEYDHRALNAEVREAEAALVAAAAESGLTGALVDYIAACMRRGRRWDEIEHALANGAQPPEGVELRGDGRASDVHGQPLPLDPEPVAAMLGRYVEQAARERIAAEQEAREEALLAELGAPYREPTDVEREQKRIERITRSRRERLLADMSPVEREREGHAP